MNPQHSAQHSRPYWHVDLKWIFGLFALFTLGAALLFFNLSNLTDRDRAIRVSATIVASLFSKEGLDDASGVNEVRQKIEATPGDTVAPIEQFPWLRISKNDALTLSPRELRIAIFSQITTPIYDKGVRGAAAQISSDPAQREKFTRDAAMLGIFTKSTHDTFQRLFYISVISTVLLTGAAVYFSSGLGRFVTPGILLVSVSPLGAFIGLMLLHPPKDGDAPFTKLPLGVAQEMGTSLSHSYLVASLAGATLLVMAMLLKIIKKVRRKAT